MRRLSLVAGSVLLLLGLGLLWTLSSSSSFSGQPVPSDRLPSPRPQARTTRQVQPVMLQQVRLFGRETFLHTVDFIHAGPEATVYVLDRGRHQVLRFDLKTGRLLQRYGKGPGEGPGEFQMITDFKVDRAGRVYVCDPVNARITLFAPDGQLLATLSLDRPPYGLALMADALLVIQLLRARSDGLFEVYRLEQKPDGTYRLRFLRRFGEFLKNQAAFSLLLDGRLTGADSFFVYAPRRIGWITAFYPDGRLRFHRETIEPIPIPRLVRRGDMEQVDRRAPIATYELTVDGPRLYTWSKGRDGQAYVDVYSAYTGDYQFSLPLDLKGLIDVQDSLIYAAHDTLVTVWRWRPAAPASEGSSS